jgi:hypothetical protein
MKKTADDKRLEKFLAGFGIDPNAKVEKRKYANKETFKLQIGAKVREIGSGAECEIIDIDESIGIILKFLNRNSEIIHEWQDQFETRINEGYLVVIN